MNFFITGTDTGVGKTYCSVKLLQQFNQLGFKTLGIKPVSTGNRTPCTSDIFLLHEAASIKLKRSELNPFYFMQALAPHLAAQKKRIVLSVQQIQDKLSKALNKKADIRIIEGIGGWHVPLNENETMADLVCAYQWPIILVVGMRLGCLNHAILTECAIKQAKLNLVGWIANYFNEDAMMTKDTIKTLENWLAAPLLGVLSFGGEEKLAINQINFLK